jgi:phage tail-like protein
VPERDPGPFANTRFRVEIDGVSSTGALEVILPEARLVARTKSGPGVRYGPLIVRRGMTASGDWYRWFDASRAGGRRPGRRVAVTLLGPDGRDATRWVFGQALPRAYAVSPLHGLGSDVLVETLELDVTAMDVAFVDQASGG